MKRTIVDSQGMRWEIWEVNPTDLGRFIYDRRALERADPGQPADNREPANESPSVHPELRDGWLCFQSATERRRFAPIPLGWRELPDSVLRVTLDIATPVAQRSDATNQPASE